MEAATLIGDARVRWKLTPLYSYRFLAAHHGARARTETKDEEKEDRR